MAEPIQSDEKIITKKITVKQERTWKTKLVTEDRDLGGLELHDDAPKRVTARCVTVI
jgi:hypothetical protein